MPNNVKALQAHPAVWTALIALVSYGLAILAALTALGVIN